MNPRALLRAAVVSLLCVPLAGVAVSAQTMLVVPKVLVAQREVVKPGKAHAHGMIEAQWAQAYRDAKASGWMGMTSLTGETRALFLQGFPSVAAWAEDEAAHQKNAALTAKATALADKDGDYLIGVRQMVMTYMPDVSYRAESIPVAGLRYWKISTVRLKTGYADEFLERRKQVKAAHEKANLDESYAMYHVTAGNDGFDTYLIFIPMKSLAEEDATNTLHGDAYQKALPEDWKTSSAKFAREAISSVETHLFAIDPKMSVANPSWVKADSFWDVKPMAKPMAKAKAADAPKQ